MAVLELSQVDTEIGGTLLLEDISFSLEAGTITALVGHNGAGKSTLMRTILNELEAAKGTIRLNGKTLEEDLLGYKRQTAYLPEEPMLLTELTAMQHFQLYAASYGLEEKLFDQRLESLLEGFELADKLHEYPESLSKGMRQKVQTICALLPDTALLCIDEPFMGLDIYAMRYLEKLILEKAAGGTAILLTSHQLERVKDLADSFIMLQHGKIEGMGPISAFETILRRSDRDEPHD